MSLFQKSEEPGAPIAFTPQEAVITLLFLVVTVDGSIAPEEEELVVATSNRMKLLRKLDIDDFNDAVQKVRDAIDAGGRDAVFSAATKSAPPDLAGTVYALAADVAFAEGSTTPEENDFLRKVQEGLGISDDLASKIVEVMRLKNLG
jgi:tellurite resistance protein